MRSITRFLLNAINLLVVCAMLMPAASALVKPSNPEMTPLYGEVMRVKSVMGSTTTGYLGSDSELSGETVTKYYLGGGVWVAMRAGNTLTYLFGDQFSSTSASYRMSDATTVKQLYKPWDEKRYLTGARGLPTTYRFTGRRMG